MFSTMDKGREEEIITIVHNLDDCFPEYAIIDGEKYNKLHDKAIQTPSELSMEEMLQITIAELKEVLIANDSPLYDDPVDFMMNMTEPMTGFTMEDAEKLLGDSIGIGWHLPPWVTAETLKEIYEDLKPSEEDEEE